LGYWSLSSAPTLGAPLPCAALFVAATAEACVLSLGSTWSSTVQPSFPAGQSLLNAAVAAALPVDPAPPVAPPTLITCGDAAFFVVPDTLRPIRTPTPSTTATTPTPTRASIGFQPACPGAGGARCRGGGAPPPPPRPA